MLLEKGGEASLPMTRCTMLEEALNQILGNARPVPQHMTCSLSVTRSATNMLGGLAARPRPTIAPQASASLAIRPVAYQALPKPAPVGEASGVYLPYRPSRIAIPSGPAHPTALVESLAMGSITAPLPTYVPQLPVRIVEDKVLSDAQLETLIYAGDAFERDLPGCFNPAEEGLALIPDPDGSCYRTGYFLADGTGTGKGRQVAAIICTHSVRAIAAPCEPLQRSLPKRSDTRWIGAQPTSTRLGRA